jgi:hypothetical protein
MNTNTPNSIHNEERTTQKLIEALGCRFTEYRGEGMPVVGKPPASPGDVYFDIGEQPYTVWAYQLDSGWKRWRSVAKSKDCKHPELERILYPTGQHFSWVPMSGYDNYLRQTKLRLGKRIDAADTHIKIILDYEHGVKPAQPLIKPPTPDRAQSPNISDDITDDSDEDEAEGQVRSMIVGSDPAEAALTKTEADIMEELRADLEHCCRIMSEKNNDIKNEITQSHGV